MRDAAAGALQGGAPRPTARAAAECRLLSLRALFHDDMA